VKLILRLVIVLVSFAVAWVVAGTVASFTYQPLVSGGYEGTPVTAVVSVGTLVATFVAALIVGNVALNRYFTARGL
jgi:hypothetical protein